MKTQPDYPHLTDLVTKSEIPLRWCLTYWCPTQQMVETSRGKIPNLQWTRRELNRMLGIYPGCRIAINEGEECCLYVPGGWVNPQ